MADKGAPETVPTTIRLRTVHELAVEEEHVSRLHDYGHGFETFRHGHVVAREGDIGIRLLGAEQLHVVGAWHDLEPTVLLVRRIEGHPGSDTRAGFDLEVEVVLVERLA